MPCITTHFDPAIGPLVNLGIALPAALGVARDSTAGEVIVHSVMALVDTGASVTCISAEVAAMAGLQVAGKQRMSSATEAREVNTYLADVALPFGAAGKSTMAMVSEAMMLMEFNAGSAKYQALLGRDIIARGLFSMIGYDRRFTICM